MSGHAANKKPASGDVSPSPSAYLLPQVRQSRRGSVSSLINAMQVDKDTLSQALDHINQHASQTDTLTTFNEFTSPPSSSSGGEGRGLASELQGGLSGLYNKLRASVGNVRDIVANAAESGAADASAVKSLKIVPPSPTSTTWSKIPTISSPSSSAVHISSDIAIKSGPQSPLVRDNVESSKATQERSPRPTRLVLGPPSTQIRGNSLTPSLPLKSPLAPLAGATTHVSAAVAEASVTGSKEESSTDFGTQGKSLAPPASRAEEQLNETVNKRKPLTAPSELSDHLSKAANDLSQKVADQVAKAVDSSKGITESGGGHRQQRRGDSDIDYFTPIRKPIDPPKIITHPGTPRMELSRASTGTATRATSQIGKNVDLTKIEPYQHLEIPFPSLQAPVAVSPNSDTSRPLTPTAIYPISPDEKHEDFYLDPKASLKALDNAADTQAKATDSKQQDAHEKTKSVLTQIKSKVLNKEYWMKDENAKDCFGCGDSFSTFRRKHHCRMCGQIFDAKCTSLLPGTPFGHPGSMRVCKSCEGIINGYDDSSEFSDDSAMPPPSLRPRHGSTGANDALSSPGPRSRPGSLRSMRQSPKHSELTAPTMSIPATRKSKTDSSRRPAVLEIDPERTLIRPSSSRSLKSNSGNGPFTPGHKRHNSRHLHQRGFETVEEDSAPFHRDVEEKGLRLPAFHDDNIIDPELAPYLSDDASSGDEQIGILAAMNGEGIARSFDDKSSLASYLGSSKKSRSRAGDKSNSGMNYATRDTDSVSVSSSRNPNMTRTSKRRNLSVAGNLHLRPSPRAHRTSAAVPASNLHESFSSSALAQMMSASTPAGPRMIRSSSMRGAAAPPVELNSASLQHVRKLLRQLLQDSNVPSVSSWERALVPILLQATDDVNPDVQNGDAIDIRHYVKLKKIPGGKPGDTSYVSGFVFTKNLALKSMSRSITNPRILILTFPLEYARHQQHFMSLEPIIRQEREFLQNLVNRIAALQPQLLLVERNISGLALDFLEKAGIATAYNVKASVLNAVSRCSQTRIISSMDKLAIKPPQAGTCASFYLKTYAYGGRKKTYMFLSGCAKQLGCSIVLRGADDATLAEMKRITEFMVYVVYNLKLETCLMRDEFALIPSVNESCSPTSGNRTVGKAAQTEHSHLKLHIDSATNASNQPEKRELEAQQTFADVSNADVLKGSKSALSGTHPPRGNPADDASMPEDVPMPTFYSDMVEEHRTKILSASPFVTFMQPYLLMRSREQERRLAYLRRLRDLDMSESETLNEKSESQTFELIKPEMVHETVRAASKNVREVLRAVHDAEYDKALHNYNTQSKQWETYISGNINLFDPRAHQNIAVLYSLVCTVTTIPCSGPDLLALGFYKEHETEREFEADCTLGQYVEDLCLSANTVCTANGCERKMFDHHRHYVHGEAQISVFVERHPCKLRGLQNTILMWSCCRKCGKETQVMPMSESTWKYSFGKYLELSFWSKDVHARADVCPHDLHRDHLRYLGFKDLALRVHYDPISLLEVIVPRTRITWKVDNDLRFKNDLYSRIEDRINKFMLSVKARIKSILIESVIPEKTEACRQEVNKLNERAREEHRALIRHLQDRYMTSKHYETVPFNQAIRATQEKVAEWDNAFAEFDRNYFPSEKDIRRLATLQLRKIFLEKDESNVSVNSSEEGTSTSISNPPTTGEKSPEESSALTPQTRNMSPEKAQDMLISVIENDTSFQHDSPDSVPADAGKIAPPTTTIPPLIAAALPTTSTERDGIQSLDLATSSELMQQREGQLDAAGATPRAIDFAVKASAAKDARITNTSHDEATSSSQGTQQVCHRPSDLPITVEQRPERDAMLQKQATPSSIPRPTDRDSRRTMLNTSPSLNRTHSQPSQHQREKSNSSDKSIQPSSALTQDAERLEEVPKPSEKKLSDRLGLTSLKSSVALGHSMIPRSTASRQKDSHVSTLAKHFEQLSREFEKERLRERRQRFSKNRQSRAYPMAAAKPVVEVYRNVREAVEEREPSDEDLLAPELSANQGESQETADRMAQTTDSQTSGDGLHAEDTTADNTETEETLMSSHIGSDAEGEELRSEEDRGSLEEIPEIPEEHQMLLPTEGQLDLKLDLPKHEKTSLMKILTNFWAERSASGWQALEYPLNAFDHIFADSDIIIREDEPSSLVAFALGSEDYKAKLRNIIRSSETSEVSSEKTSLGAGGLESEDQAEMQRTMTRSTGTHLKYQFQEGSAKMLCKVFYAEQFDAVRRKCGVSERMVESLSRCMKWDSKGGKTKSVFLKTLDDRFVLKSLPPGETQTFLKFAPAYFQLMAECLWNDLPSVIAKMLGFYQIIIKNPLTGVDFNWYLIVMENLFYDRSPTRIFDLKGSMRNRRIQSTGEQNEVLLDENMVEFIYESPLFSREHSKKLLRASVWNDTLFLSRQNVMDYSLMIAIDEERSELVVGIIDVIRTYTWDKKLESWIKDRGKMRPTVTSPRDYKNRFREAMGRYVLQAPNCWHQFHIQQLETKALRTEKEKDGEAEAQAQAAVL